MGFMRKDGKYKIYIVQFLSKDGKEWSYAGSCDHWFPKGITRKKYEQYAHKGVFSHLNAIGECWQKTGIFGSFHCIDAIRAMDKVAEWNPGRAFRVCKLEIEQKTTQIAEFKYD